MSARHARRPAPLFREQPRHVVADSGDQLILDFELPRFPARELARISGALAVLVPIGTLLAGVLLFATWTGVTLVMTR